MLILPATQCGESIRNISIAVSPNRRKSGLAKAACWRQVYTLTSTFMPFSTTGRRQREKDMGWGDAIPPFMTEGSATFVQYMYFDSISGWRMWAEFREELVYEVSFLEIALDDPTLVIHPQRPQYTLGTLATEWLVARSGGKSVADYYYALSQQELRPEDGARRFDLAGERAFREFWGINSDEFYRQFACWRDRGFPLAEVGKECVSP